MPDVNENRIQSFETPEAFSGWLATHHDSEPELWLKIYKKKSGHPTINWQQAVIEALRWGWIDGIKKSLNDEAYLQRFTPRRKNSTWSKRNREHVEQLIKENKMQEPGMKQVRAAQNDGRWDAVYAPASEMVIPADLLTALEQHPEAKAFFETLNKTNLFAITSRLETARKPETRQRRFNKILDMLKQGKKFH